MSSGEVQRYRNRVLESRYRDHFMELTKVSAINKELAESMPTSSGELIPVEDMNITQKLSYGIVQVLSKPNTHRLRELYIQLRVLWLHSVWLGAFSLEKVHQRIKRILWHSNRHDEHVLAMNSARFGDWQARLHVCLVRHETNVVIDAFLASRR